MVGFVSALVLYHAAEKTLDWAKKLKMICQFLDNERKEIFSDVNSISNKLSHVNHSLQVIEAKLDNQVTRIAGAAMEHLKQGISASTQEVRSDELKMARTKLAELIHLDPNSTTSGIENKYLIGMGYWGNYHYFNLRREYKTALLQVYECCEKFPVVGASLFDEKFFDKNYRYPLQDYSEKLRKLELASSWLKNNMAASLHKDAMKSLDEAERTWNPLKKGKKLLEGAAATGGAMIMGGISTLGESFYPEEVAETLRSYLLFDPKGGLGFLPTSSVQTGESERLNRVIEETKGEMKLLESEFISECRRKKLEIGKIKL